MFTKYLLSSGKVFLRLIPAIAVTLAFGFAPAANAAPTEIVAINSGGPAVSNSGGGDNSFIADSDYSGGGTDSSTHTITVAGVANAAPMALYQTERAGTFTYTIPGLVAGNQYAVLLHFAEYYWTAAGKRVFNVAINGATVLSNFDIYATVGANKALVETFTAAANSSGQIVISYTNGGHDQPKSSGIEIQSAAVAMCSAVPPAPTGLAIGTVSSSSIAFSWSAVTPPANCTISSYSVYNASTGAAIASGLTGTTYTNTGLAASTKYSYYVIAIDADGTSADSATVSGTTSANATCAAAPAAPAGLTAGTVTSNSIPLTWSAVTPPANCTISSYSVYSSTGILIVSGLTSPSYTVTGLAASTAYSYYVVAIDAFGTSPDSSTVSATTASGSSSTEIAAINLGGPAVSNASGGDASFVADEFFSGGGTSTSSNFVVTAGIANAAPEAVYQSARSGTSTYTIQGLAAGAQYTVLLHFAETYFKAAGSREFDVAINGATVLTNFDIYATAGADTALVESFTATASSSGQIVIAFSNGSANQPSVSGIEIRGKTSACTLVPSGAPTGLTALAASPSIIGLSWAPVTPGPNCAITYNVYASTTSGFTPSASNQIASGLTGSTFNNTGLAAATTYYYSVVAVDSTGSSAASTEASAETNAANSCFAIPPSAPTGLGATTASSSAIELTWNAITPQANCTNTTYSLYGSSTSGFTPSLTNQIASNLTGTTFFNTNLPTSTTYYFVVQAADEDGASPVYSGQESAATLAAPTALTATATSANEVDLVWPESTIAIPVTYNIYRSTTSPAAQTTANEIGTTKSNAFQDVLASASTTYYYSVLATSPNAASVAVDGTVSATTLALGSAAPFWDASNIPATPAGDAMMFKILNRTNGRYPDDQVTWSFTIGSGTTAVTTTNTIAAQDVIAMPANASGRMTFYLGPEGTSSPYVDFIEYTIGGSASAGYFFNGDTTRVDAFAVKLAFNLNCGSGTPLSYAVGENSATFAEDRSATFQRFIDAVPSEFKQLGQIRSPYSIPEPGAGGFNTGGVYADYYAAYVASVWASNDLTFPEAGPNLSGLGAYPGLSAALARHVAGPDMFTTAGVVVNGDIWGNPNLFYQTDPSDHYAEFWHANAINFQQYGFPYDDSGGYSSDVSCNDPQTLLVAVGW